MSDNINEKEIEAAALAEAAAPAEAEAPAEVQDAAPEEEKVKKPANRMKAFVIGLVAVCIVIIGALGWKSFKDGDFLSFADRSEHEAVVFEGIDYAKLYKTHKPGDIALSVSGSDFRWDEYFGWVYNMGEQVSSYFQSTYAYYGVQLGWGDNISEESDLTYFDVVKSGAEDYLKQIVCIEKAAEENGIVLDEADEAAIDQVISSSITGYCGEGATEKDFEEFLSEIYMPFDFFKRSIAQNIRQEKLFTKLYGADCSLVSDGDALAFLEENGFMYASHILLMNKDADGNELDEAAMAEKLELANDIVAQLRGISGTAKRVERFRELKEEYCEDTGKVMYPSGYMFTSGQFIGEFEDTYNTLDDYEVSDPVLSDYGYHIIIRLPLDPDAVITYDSSTYEAINARNQAANQQFSEYMQSVYDTLTVEYKPGFENLRLAKYLTKLK